MRGILSEHRHRYGGRGRQVLTGVVDYERYGLPDIGVYTSRFEDRNMMLGTRGRRGLGQRLEGRLRGLRRTMVEVSRSRAAQ